MLGDFGAFFRHQLLQGGIPVQLGQRQIGQITERLDEKMSAAAGVVEDLEVREGFAIGDGVLHGGFDQRLRQGRRRVVAGRGLAGIAGAFEVDRTLLDADFTQGAEAFFLAQIGLVIGVEMGFDGLAPGGRCFRIRDKRRFRWRARNGIPASRRRCAPGG